MLYSYKFNIGFAAFISVILLCDLNSQTINEFTDFSQAKIIVPQEHDEIENSAIDLVLASLM